MFVLKAARQVVGLAWIAVFIWGVVSLFRGDWAGVGLAALAWLLLGVVFYYLTYSLQGRMLATTRDSYELITEAVLNSDWDGALRLSTQAIRSTASVAQNGMAGSGEEQARLRSFAALVSASHGVLQGAAGYHQEGRATLSEFVSRASGGASVPGIESLRAVVEPLLRPWATDADFRQAAYELFGPR